MQTHEENNEQYYDYGILEVPEAGVAVSPPYGEKTSDSCQFVDAWIGECGEETVNGGNFCEEHNNQVCGVDGCDNQATGTCPVTFGIVCDVPLCYEHEHKDHKSMV